MNSGPPSAPQAVQQTTKESPLTTQEQRDLQQHEHIITQGLDTFTEVGQALLDIRDRRLYRGAHKTFEAYCREKWGFTKSRANQLVDAACIVNVLENDNHGCQKPQNERQIRPLTKLKDPDQQKQVWNAACETAQREGRPVTAVDVKRVVEKKTATNARSDSRGAAATKPLGSHRREDTRPKIHNACSQSQAGTKEVGPPTREAESAKDDRFKSSDSDCVYVIKRDFPLLSDAGQSEVFIWMGNFIEDKYGSKKRQELSRVRRPPTFAGQVSQYGETVRV